MCPLLSDDSQASHIPFFPPTPSLTCLPPHLSPFQPMPYLLNPASVTALNAKALPRQMIKVSSQFTLQCIDLMFPNLPGLSLMLPRTFRIFHSVPPFPAFLYLLSLHFSLSHCNKNMVDRDVSLVMSAYIFIYVQKKNGWFKITHPTQSSAVIHVEPTTSKPPSLLQCNYCPSFTCCFKYCFRVNHPLVLIYHTSFASHHLFICNSLLSWLLCFSDCHFPLRGCSEHFHVLFNYENLIWQRKVCTVLTHNHALFHTYLFSLSVWRWCGVRGAET